MHLFSFVRAHRGAPSVAPARRRGRGPITTFVSIAFVATIAAGTLTVSLPAERTFGAIAPIAAVIVGPSGKSTSEYLGEGRRFADQAEAAGMRVRRVFHPYATWGRVLDATRGANLVVYFGHGNGWPSQYAPYQERTKNGFGLNSYAGSSGYSHTYYGADSIRRQMRLADDAVVILYRSCYSAGNSEVGMPIPSSGTAVQRVDNYAAAFLRPKVGASVVMAFWTKQWINFPRRLMRSGRSMDDIFRTRSSQPGWRTSGWIGTHDFYAQSDRTPGARLHLDRHPQGGYSRAISGDLEMTTNEWLSR